ncbi:MAG: anaerobic ribonucleoside-triphosphate reductase [Clostridia bacterium]
MIPMETSIQVLNGTLPEAELRAYVDHGVAQYGRTPKAMTVTVDGDYVDVDYAFEGQPFDRIRRITGYLVGTLDRFNNAKRAEEHDRVKHSLS